MESCNYGIKEETTLRMVGGAEMGNGLVPLPCVADKNQEGYLRSKGSQTHTKLHSPGFQNQAGKSP